MFQSLEKMEYPQPMASPHARFTTRNLADGIGLDSAAGISVSKPGGGNYNVNIQACLTKLADTIANGGANISFAANSAGSAVVSISAECSNRWVTPIEIPIEIPIRTHWLTTR